jgi:dTDP-4-dehydrorhamnose 3,5-epimerase
MSEVPLLYTPNRFSDDRGWFSETYNQRRMQQAGLTVDFVQDNQSFSAQAGTLRGLHFQAPPHAQGKLVRAVRGAILDVAVDIRKGSPTYGHAVTAELTADNGRQLYIPIGYAHGFVTLSPDTEVAYKVTDFYDKASEGGIIWNDPDLAIEWGLNGSEPHLSAKDQLLPLLASFDSPFTYAAHPCQLVTL